MDFADLISDIVDSRDAGDHERRAAELRQRAECTPISDPAHYWLADAANRESAEAARIRNSK